MVAARRSGDAWYTALYLHPRKNWWAPGLIAFALIFAFNQVVVQRSQLESAFPAVMVGGLLAYLSKGRLT